VGPARRSLRNDFLEGASEIVAQHHERYNGSGYPNRMEGDQICLGARIFAVADAVDAMTSDRPYRAARSFDDAAEELIRCSGAHFDPFVVEAFTPCRWTDGEDSPAFNRARPV
jgi:HD-GYP domain-containing protein (c-di-GMP phosphodiesterase class II)